MHTGFAQDRDGKNTLENVIIELSFDQEKFYSFMWMMLESVDGMLELVWDWMMEKIQLQFSF